jgi:hypothetical protein
LFSGIGGFDKGLEDAGFEIAWQVEIDEYCRKVLKKHWPSVPKFGDVKTFNWALAEARRCGVCFCNSEVRSGDEYCADCAVVRCVTPEFVGLFSKDRTADAVTEAIWNGEPLLSWREQSARSSPQQSREGGYTRFPQSPQEVRALWERAAAIQGWVFSHTSPPSRLREAVRRAMALPEVPPPGAQACLKEIMVKPSAIKADLICGGFP